MKMFSFFFGLFVLTTMTNVASATIMPILEVDSSQYTISDFDFTDPGNELKIDYFVKNVSTFTDPGNAFENIEINAGTNQGVYDALVPAGWEAILYEDKTRFHTSDFLYYIYPGETEPVEFSLYYSTPQLTAGQSQAMSPLGFWSDTVPALTADVPEPSMIALLGFGIFYLRKRKRIS